MTTIRFENQCVHVNVATKCGRRLIIPFYAFIGLLGLSFTLWSADELWNCTETTVATNAICGELIEKENNKKLFVEQTIEQVINYCWLDVFDTFEIKTENGREQKKGFLNKIGRSGSILCTFLMIRQMNQFVQLPSLESSSRVHLNRFGLGTLILFCFDLTWLASVSSFPDAVRLSFNRAIHRLHLICSLSGVIHHRLLLVQLLLFSEQLTLDCVFTLIVRTPAICRPTTKPESVRAKEIHRPLPIKPGQRCRCVFLLRLFACKRSWQLIVVIRIDGDSLESRRPIESIRKKCLDTLNIFNQLYWITLKVPSKTTDILDTFCHHRSKGTRSCRPK